ncbi:YdiY family protein [Parasphingorhabdus sp.]|uniref:DUF481 domain-containing protein n=1 Tax=Parasphingorhabdus sp. TaxID=2709688 RepID=UPI00359407A4
MKFTVTAALVAVICITSPAKAQIADPLRAAIDAAIEGGNASEVDTVAKFAKKAQPDAVDDIDALVGAWKTRTADDKQAALAQAGLFDNWEGEGQLGFLRTTGNTDNLGFNAGLRIGRNGLDWTHELRALVDYQKTNDIITRERIMAAVESQYRFDETAFAFGQLQYERDRFQGVRSRYAVAGGIGWTVLDEPSYRLALKAGPAFRHTDYTDGVSEDVITGLAALDGEWTIASGLKLTEHAETFVAADNSTLTSTTALDAKLIGALSARLSYTLDYETAPPAGQVKLDTLSRASLVYDF